MKRFLKIFFVIAQASMGGMAAGAAGPAMSIGVLMWSEEPRYHEALQSPVILSSAAEAAQTMAMIVSAVDAIFLSGSSIVGNAVAMIVERVPRQKWQPPSIFPVLIKYSTSEYPPLRQAASLRNEFDILQGINCAQVILAHSLERLHNRLLLVQEDFGGVPLTRYLSTAGISTTFSIEVFLELAIAVTFGLVAIHAGDVIHKNISPAAILFNPETRQVKIIDFAIATRLFHEDQGLKNPDGLEGTLAYVSPEQTGRMNLGLDFRTDLYSRGATFYRLSAGVPPFACTDAMRLVPGNLQRLPEKGRLYRCRFRSRDSLNTFANAMLAHDSEYLVDVTGGTDRAGHRQLPSAHESYRQDEVRQQTVEPVRTGINGALRREIEAGRFNAGCRFPHDRVQQPTSKGDTSWLLYLHLKVKFQSRCWPDSLPGC